MITLTKLMPYTGDCLAPSPNHGVRRAPAIQGIVLHATADEGDEALTLSWMRSPKSRVSCHLLVSRTGRATRLVGDQQRAWHAGVSWWRGTDDVNSITVGIEIANRNDGEPYTDAQYQRVAEIVAHYCQQGLSLDDVVSHALIAQGRRTDPFGWDWDRFRDLVRQRLLPPADAPVIMAQSRTPARTKLSPVASPIPAVATRAVKPFPPSVAKVAAPKPALYSRTLWLNGLTVLASSGVLVNDTLDLAHRVGLVLPEHFTKWALLCLGLLNMLLRFRTTRPLTCSKNGKCTYPDGPLMRAAHAPGQEPSVVVARR